MWFHRPFRADEWMLYDQYSISTSNARGLAGGSIYTKNGDLAITVVVAGAASMPLVWSLLHDYQRRRILTLIDPSSDPLGAGYHIIQSQIASGGACGDCKTSQASAPFCTTSAS